MIEQQRSTVQKSAGPRILLLIAGIPIVIILLSTLLYYGVESRSINLGTVNNGELIVPPVRLTDFELTNLDGQPYDYTKPKPKWTFVVFGGQDCTGSCEKMLYLTRQTNIALAKKMNRVRRFYVTDQGEISQKLKQQIDKSYKNLSVLSMSHDSIVQLFNGTGVDPFQKNRFFVVDDHGWLMMHYTAKNIEGQVLNTLGKDVLRDMKRLLK